MYKPTQIFLQKINVIDVIDEYVKLTKKGQSWVGLCPFHDDKSPSMYVQERFFKCFACDAKGNAITFLQKYKNLTFLQAIKELVQKFNIPFEGVDLETLKKEDANLAELKESSEYNFFIATLYQNHLWEQPQALQYLTHRKINEATIEHFMLGYSGNDSYRQYLQKTIDFANNPEISYDFLVLLGVLTPEGNDVFYQQIIIPIFNHQNYLVGFVGRSIDLKKQPLKYLNTAGKKFFVKSQILFNYHNFLKLKNQSRIIIVEGYFDVFALYQNNILNVVALMGVSLSQFHIETLKNNQKIKEIILCLDMDEAGFEATLKIYQKLQNLNYWSISLISLWDLACKDIDEMNHKLTSQQFMDLFETNQTITIVQYYLAYLKVKPNCQKNQELRYLQQYLKTLKNQFYFEKDKLELQNFFGIISSQVDDFFEKIILTYNSNFTTSRFFTTQKYFNNGFFYNRPILKRIQNLVFVILALVCNQKFFVYFFSKNKKIEFWKIKKIKKISPQKVSLDIPIILEKKRLIIDYFNNQIKTNDEQMNIFAKKISYLNLLEEKQDYVLLQEEIMEWQTNITPQLMQKLLTWKIIEHNVSENKIIKISEIILKELEDLYYKKSKIVLPIDVQKHCKSWNVLKVNFFDKIPKDYRDYFAQKISQTPTSTEKDDLFFSLSKEKLKELSSKNIN